MSENNNPSELLKKIQDLIKTKCEIINKTASETQVLVEKLEEDVELGKKKVYSLEKAEEASTDLTEKGKISEEKTKDLNKITLTEQQLKEIEHNFNINKQDLIVKLNNINNQLEQLLSKTEEDIKLTQSKITASINSFGMYLEGNDNTSKLNKLLKNNNYNNLFGDNNTGNDIGNKCYNCDGVGCEECDLQFGYYKNMSNFGEKEDEESDEELKVESEEDSESDEDSESEEAIMFGEETDSDFSDN